MRLLQGCSAVLVGIIATPLLWAATLTVDPSGGGDYTDIQPAIDAAEDGDTVLVRPGEYQAPRPVVINPLPGPLAPAIPLVKSITLRSEKGPDETFIKAGVALQGAILGFWLTQERSLVEGFTLVAPEGPAYDEILGVRCQDGASPTISGCRFVGEFRDAIECAAASPTLIGCEISGSRRYGVYCRFNSAPRLSACTLWDNHFGLGCFEDSAPVLVNCSLQGNWAVGAECAGSSSPTLVNCTITGSVGCGLSRREASLPTLINCVIWTSPEHASISVSLDIPVEELAAWLESRVRRSHYDGISHVREVLTGAPDPRFLSPGRWDDSGTPLDDEDDRWVPGDYRLEPGSPLVDAGTAEGAPADDLDGNPRPCGAAVDIGAHEYCGADPGTRFVRGDTNVDSRTDLSDAVGILGYLFLGEGLRSLCEKSADIDDSATVDITDAVFLLVYEFLGGPAPSPPFPDCGLDQATPDELTCEGFLGCP